MAPRTMNARNDDDLLGLRTRLRRLHAARVFGGQHHPARLYNHEGSTRFGLSVVPLSMLPAGATAGKWGSDEQIRQDLTRLGASLVSFPGRFDLTWHKLTTLSRARVIPENPSTTAFPADPMALLDLVASPENITRLAEALRGTAAAGTKVVLTAIHTEGEPRIGDNEEWQKHGFSEGIELHWSGDHIEDELGVVGLNEKRTEVIDPSSPYNRLWLTELSVALASLLRRVQEDLATDGLLLADVLAGVSFFHVPSTRCVWPGESHELTWDGRSYETTRWQSGDAITSAIHWSALWWSCASTFRLACRSFGIDVPVRLPTMGPWYEVDLEGVPRRHSRRYRLEFWGEFLRRIAVYSLRTWEGSVSLADVADAMTFQWDHKARADAGDESNQPFRVGPRHLTHMLADADAIQSLLDRHGFASTRLCVLQTGTSVLDPDDFVPDVLAGDRLHWQATEVWRRLSGALVVGGGEVALQAWMADSKEVTRGAEPTREYYGMGLRVDSASPVAGAAAAIQRPAWHAFQRLVSHLGKVRRAELLSPTTRPDDVTWEPETERDKLLLFHFEVDGTSPSDARHYYLAMWDLTSTSESRALLQLRWAAGAITGSDRPERRPDLTREAAVVATGLLRPGRTIPGDDLRLPVTTSVFAEDEVVLLDGSRVTWVEVDHASPVLVRSTHPINASLLVLPLLEVSDPVLGRPDLVDLPDTFGPVRLRSLGPSLVPGP